MVNSSRLKDQVDMWEEVMCTFTTAFPFLRKCVQTPGECLGSFWGGGSRGKTNGLEVQEEKVLVHERTVHPSHQEWRNGALCHWGVYKPDNHCQPPVTRVFIALNKCV